MQIAGVDVSRETFERLKSYEHLVQKWNPSINLVAKSTISDIWNRHFVDSLQIVPIIRSFPKTWADLGSGGGFPGLVIAAYAKEVSPDTQFKLIESDQRKATFLRTVIRTLDLNVDVTVKRIEEAEPSAAGVITARALANLDELYTYASRHMSIDGRMVFMKGQSFQSEIEMAKENWNFDVVTHQSITDNRSKIIEAWNLERIR